jgi:hypothetical protein
MREEQKKKAKQMVINMVPPMVPFMKKQNSAVERDQGRELPATEVAIVRSSEQSLMSSIRIGEFSMNTSKKGNTTTFAMAIRENLF